MFLVQNIFFCLKTFIKISFAQHMQAGGISVYVAIYKITHSNLMVFCFSLLYKKVFNYYKWIFDDRALFAMVYIE